MRLTVIILIYDLSKVQRTPELQYHAPKQRLRLIKSTTDFRGLPIYMNGNGVHLQWVNTSP